MQVIRSPAEDSWKVTREELSQYLKNNDEMPTYVLEQNHICAVHAVSPDYEGGSIYICTPCNSVYGTGYMDITHIVLQYHEYPKILSYDVCWCYICKKNTFTVFGPRFPEGSQFPQSQMCPWCPREYHRH